jgi:thioredoxin-related protein
VTVSLFAETNWADDYKSALKEAKSEQKKVILFFIKEGCAKCDEMLWTMNSDKNVSKYINSNFVAVEIDIEYDKREGYKIYSTPTVYFLNTNAEQIGKAVVEALGPKGFLKKLKEVENTKK